MNLGSMRTLVLSWLDDPNAGYFTPAQVNVWLNNAQREAAKQLMQAYENYFLKVAYTTLIVNQADYVLPSDFKKLNRLELVLSGTGVNENRNRLYPMPLNQADQIGPRSGNPIVYNLRKNRFTLYPTPSEALVLRLYYSTMPVDLVNDTDVPDIPEEYHEYICVLAAFDGFIKDDRVPTNLVEKKTKYLELMKQEMLDRNIDQSRTILSEDDGFAVLF